MYPPAIIQKNLHFPHLCVYMFRTIPRNKGAVVPVNSIMQLIFVMQILYIYCDVGTEFLRAI
jgi:hypothetical protein